MREGAPRKKGVCAVFSAVRWARKAAACASKRSQRWRSWCQCPSFRSALVKNRHFARVNNRSVPKGRYCTGKANVAGSVLATGPADVWHKVAPVPVDEPVLAVVHGGAGCRVGARHNQVVPPLHVTVRVGVQHGGGGGAGPPMVVSAAGASRGRSRVCR